MSRTTNDGRSPTASPARSPTRSPIISHILKAIEIEGGHLMPVARVANGLADQPRSVLALLVYHYTIGILASREIESSLWSDAPLRSLCRDDLPDWRRLRRFRRLNHGAVRNCLAHVLAAQSHDAAEPKEDATVDSRRWFAEANGGVYTAIIRHELVVRQVPEDARRVVTATPRIFTDFGLAVGVQF